MFDFDDNSFIKAGLYMIIYLGIVLICFFVLSSPLNSILDAFDDADLGDATDEMNIFLPNIRTGLWMFFAIMIAVPIFGFVVWVFRTEPDRYQRIFRR